MPFQWFKPKSPLTTRSYKTVGTCDYHPNTTKTQKTAEEMVKVLEKQGLDAKIKMDSYGGTHYYALILAKAKPLKKFKGIAWIHPRGGGDDYTVNVKVSAPNLEEAKADVRKHLIKKYHTNKNQVDDFSIKEVKR